MVRTYALEGMQCCRCKFLCFDQRFDLTRQLTKRAFSNEGAHLKFEIREGITSIAQSTQGDVNLYSPVLIGGSRRSGCKTVVGTSGMMLLDFHEQATQDLDERFHGDTTGTVAFLLAVLIGGRRQTFDHLPDKGVDLVVFRFTEFR